MAVFRSVAFAAMALYCLAPMAASALQAPAAAASDVLTNDSVLKLIAAGIPEQAIIAKIQSSKTAFDLSTDRMIELKGKGVSGPVLAAMLSPSAGPAGPTELSVDSADLGLPHYPGVYMFGPQANKLVRITATASDQAKTGGIIGYALTMGIASASIKATIPGPQAKVRTAQARPVFYFFFDESVPRALQVGGSSVWQSGAGNLTSSPTELSLVKFNQKPKSREARVGSINIAGSKQGVMDQDRIAFDSEIVRPGVFKVVPGVDLFDGEYGFIQTLAGGNVSGGGGALTARVYDFGIKR